MCETCIVCLMHAISIGANIHTCTVEMLRHSKGCSCTGASDCAQKLDGDPHLTMCSDYQDLVQDMGNVLMCMDTALFMDSLTMFL